MHYWLLLKTYSFVILSWLYIFLVLTGLGIWLTRFFKIQNFTSEILFSSFWLGFGAVIFILQIWNLFLKVDFKIFIIISVIGISGLAFDFKNLWQLILKSYSKLYYLYLIIVLILAIWLTHRAILPPLNPDSANYHMVAVKWINNYPAVPGLGNLFDRLAYNNSSFLYVAFLEAGFWFQKSSYIANGILILVLLSFIILCVFRLFNNKSSFKYHNILLIFLFAPLFRESWLSNMSSPSPDLPIFLMGILLGYYFLKLIEDYKNKETDQGFFLFIIIVLSTTGIVIKLSFAVVGLLTMIITFILWIIKIKSKFILFKKEFVISLISPIFALIPWIIRGIIFSGYPFYPVAFSPFNFDWKIPVEDVALMNNSIKGYTRLPSERWKESLGNWHWLREWAIKNILHRLDLIWPILLIIIGLLLIIIFRKKFRKELTTIKSIKFYWFFPIPFIFSIIYWFLSAPDPRYAGSTIWVLGIGIFTMSLIFIINFKTPKFKMKILIVLLSLFLTITYCWHYLPIKGEEQFVKTLIFEGSIRKSIKIIHFENYLFPVNTLKRSWENDAFYDIPEAKLKEFKTYSGLIVYVPLDGLCWYAPLPCTAGISEPNPKLKLRVDSNLRYGFTTK